VHGVRPLTAAAVLLLAAVAVVTSTGAARADKWGGVDCTLTPNDPACQVTVVDSGREGRSSRGGGGGPMECRFAGQVVDCYNGFGWLGAGGCYYAKDPGWVLQPNEWIKRCLDPTAPDVYANFGVVLLPDPPATFTALLQRAVSRLHIPQPVLAASPALTAPQVVRVPVWWWLRPGSWAAQSATASLPGIAITATATPDTVTWDAGDGTATSCNGPGTPWTAAYPPSAPSPTCGHVYTSTSRTSPGGKFTVRASISWTITWAGGGLAGTEPSVTTTATADVSVTEVRAVIQK
jgi:hypothetical protein